MPENGQIMYPILRYFEYSHLPEKLQKISKTFCNLSYKLSENCPYCTETEVALRKLLEAKDAAVRSGL